MVDVERGDGSVKCPNMGCFAVTCAVCSETCTGSLCSACETEMEPVPEDELAATPDKPEKVRANEVLISLIKRMFPRGGLNCLFLDCGRTTAMMRAALGDEPLIVTVDAKATCVQAAARYRNTHALHGRMCAYLRDPGLFADAPAVAGFDVVWLDYFGTYTGSRSTNIYPNEETRRLLSARMRRDGAPKLLGITFCTRDRKLRRRKLEADVADMGPRKVWADIKRTCALEGWEPALREWIAYDTIVTFFIEVRPSAVGQEGVAWQGSSEEVSALSAEDSEEDEDASPADGTTTISELYDIPPWVPGANLDLEQARSSGLEKFKALPQYIKKELNHARARASMASIFQRRSFVVVPRHVDFWKELKYSWANKSRDWYETSNGERVATIAVPDVLEALSKDHLSDPLLFSHLIDFIDRVRKSKKESLLSFFNVPIIGPISVSSNDLVEIAAHLGAF
jgi:hypothetical protein